VHYINNPTLDNFLKGAAVDVPYHDPVEAVKALLGDRCARSIHDAATYECMYAPHLLFYSKLTKGGEWTARRQTGRDGLRIIGHPATADWWQEVNNTPR
jgi:hypothetical protein